MSMYKDKVSLFANIFSNLDSDSDDESNRSQRASSQSLKRESPSAKGGSQNEGTTIKSIKLDPPGESQSNATTSKETPTVSSTIGCGGDVIDISSSDGSFDANKQPDRVGEHVLYDIDSSSGDIIALDQDDVLIAEVARQNATNQTQTTTTRAEDSEASLGANDSSFFEDYNYKLRINRSGRYEQFTMTYKSKISDTLKDLIDELAQVGKALVLTRDGETISLDGSPHSLKLSPGDILEAIEVQPNRFAGPTNSNTAHECIDNLITLKLQDGNRKHSKEFQIAMDQPMGRLKQEYAKEFEIDITCMKLSFDGDIVDDQQTPEDLDIDDGCVIDVLLPQTIAYVAPPSPVDLVSPVKEKTPRGRRPARRCRRGR